MIAMIFCDGSHYIVIKSVSTVVFDPQLIQGCMLVTNTHVVINIDSYDG